MPYYGPQEDEYMLFLEKTFMLSTYLAFIGYGASLILVRREREVIDSRNRCASRTVQEMRILSMGATQMSRETCVLPPRVHNCPLHSRVIGHGLLYLGN